MSTRPRVTVGMPVYNGAALLPAALDSILAQTLEDFELVISDNASTDATESICRAYAARDRRVRYYRNERNLGAAPNFNRLVGLASDGVPYFKWAAHDDVIAPTFLERCVAALEAAGPAAVLAFPRRRYVGLDGRPLPASQGGGVPSYDRISFARLLKVSPGHFPIFTWGVNRLEALRRTRLLGGYVWSDLVLAAELRLLGEFREVPEELYFQRWLPPKQRRNGRVEAMYLNTASRNKVVLPGINLFAQHLSAIRSAPLGPTQKLRCLAAMGGYLGCRVRRAVTSGSLNRHVWDEARHVADALALMTGLRRGQAG